MIVVDALFDTSWADKRKWPYAQSCHLSSDRFGDAGEAELLAFAKRLGLRESWMQHRGRDTVHFDLTPAKRALAVKLGAVEVDAVEFARQQLAAIKEKP